jgi:hypothetical protein
LDSLIKWLIMKISEFLVTPVRFAETNLPVLIFSTDVRVCVYLLELIICVVIFKIQNSMIGSIDE